MVAEIQHINSLSITLLPGGGGVFIIRLDGDVIYDKSKSGSFPLAGEIVALIS